MCIMNTTRFTICCTFILYFSFCASLWKSVGIYPICRGFMEAEKISDLFTISMFTIILHLVNRDQLISMQTKLAH